jgi:hypothetical protein
LHVSLKIEFIAYEDQGDNRIVAMMRRVWRGDAFDSINLGVNPSQLAQGGVICYIVNEDEALTISYLAVTNVNT